MRTPVLRVLILCVVLVAMIAMPLSWVDHGPTLCLFKTVTGNECPGCGMTRALVHAAHGDVTGAWNFNWRWVLVAPLLVFISLRPAFSTVRDHRSTVTK